MGIRTGGTAKRSIMVTNGPAESSRTLNPASRIAAHQPIDVATLPSGLQRNVARHRRGVYRRLSHDGKLSQGRSGVLRTATVNLLHRPPVAPPPPLPPPPSGAA